MATIRFSELQPVTTPTANSVFAIGDTNAGVSKKITFSDLTDSIITPNLFSDNASDIITAINGDANTGNGLSAQTLFYNQEYRAGYYFLNYNNFVNTPDIPNDLSDLTNTTGFVRFDSSNARLSYIPTSGGRVDISTTFIREGTNLYYTDERVESFFDERFGDYYTQFSTTFDEGNVTDSYFDTEGEFQNISGSGEQIQSDRIRVTDPERRLAYSEGQILRIYGASANLSDKLDTTVATFSITPVNFPTDGTTVDFQYQIAEFDYASGEIAPAGASANVSIRVPDALSPQGNTLEEQVKNSFNETYFLRLNLSSTSSSRGVLVYRRTPSDPNLKLVAVLGPKDIDTGIWIDYYDTDYNSWSGKADDNSYSNIVHFPLTPPYGSRRGWIDREIRWVYRENDFVVIGLADTIFINADTNCQIAHNDTSKIQSAINSNATAGIKTVSLNAKRYVASYLTIPDSFGIHGTTNITRITRLPWALFQSTSNFIKTSTASGASEISFVSLDIDGNALNTYQFPDSVNIETNYAVNLGDAPVNIVFDRVRILNPIGGGVYAPNHENLRITNCQFLDSGLSDRLANLYSPLYATNGTNIVATSNRFENFTDNVDISITNKGIFTNNIIVNCGSGLFTYGSSFVSAEDNVIIGPAGEFISAPDTLNSEYDSVNISLENAYLSGGQYTSTNYVYQENGLSFDLTANTGVEPSRGGTSISNFANVYYDTFFIQKTATGVEEIYEANTGIVLNDRAGLDKSIGEFGFTIDSGTVGDIANANGQYSYTTLSGANPDHVGIVYTANFERGVAAGTFSSGTVDSNTTITLIMNGSAKYIAVGSEVRVEVGGTSTANVPTTTGIVTSYEDTTDDIVEITFAGANISGTIDTGSLNIIDRFVMAKGRIL